MKFTRTRSLIVAALLGLGATAHANLVTNGGFETGNLTGWTAFGGQYTNVSTGGHSGAFKFEEFDNSGFATLQQSLATVAGTTYDLSFWSRAYVDVGGNILRYQAGSGPIATAVRTTSWSQTTDSFVATGASTMLSFYIETDPGTATWLLDDISVVASSSVPDSSNLVVFVIAALGLVGFRKSLRVRSA